MCQSGVDVRDRFWNDAAALSVCFANKRASTCRMCLHFCCSKSADVNLRTANAKQETPLTLLCVDSAELWQDQQTTQDIFPLLVEAKADVHAENAAGFAPMHLLSLTFGNRNKDSLETYACILDTFLPKIKLCLERGADVRVLSEPCFGETPLLDWMKHPSMLALLTLMFAFGADPYHPIRCDRDSIFESLLEYPLSFLNHAMVVHQNRPLFPGICDLSTAICTGLDLARSLRQSRYLALCDCLNADLPHTSSSSSSFSVLFRLSGLVRIISDYAGGALRAPLNPCGCSRFSVNIQRSFWIFGSEKQCLRTLKGQGDRATSASPSDAYSLNAVVTEVNFFSSLGAYSPLP